jgi:hypothetical protein
MNQKMKPMLQHVADLLHVAWLNILHALNYLIASGISEHTSCCGPKAGGRGRPILNTPFSDVLQLSTYLIRVRAQLAIVYLQGRSTQ